MDDARWGGEALTVDDAFATLIDAARETGEHVSRGHRIDPGSQGRAQNDGTKWRAAKRRSGRRTARQFGRRSPLEGQVMVGSADPNRDSRIVHDEPVGVVNELAAEVEGWRDTGGLSSHHLPPPLRWHGHQHLEQGPF
jgi:hypothetical protein